MHVEGIKAALANVNADGGIHGRKIELLVQDDGYVADRATKNISEFIESQSVLALISVMGTPSTLAALKLTEPARVPLVGPITGANSIRSANGHNTFFVRPSYQDEVQQLARQLGRFGMRDVGIAYLDNAFGKEALESMQAALANHKITSVGAVALPADGKGGEQAAAAMAQLKPAGVLLASTGTATTGFVLPFRKQMPSVPLAGLSVSVISSEMKHYGGASRGLALTAVFPDIDSGKLSVSRMAREAMARAKTGAINNTSFEGWLNAMLMIEGLKQAGRDLTRDSLRTALAGIRRLELGDYTLGFGEKAPYVGSKYMDLVVYGESFRRVG